MTSIIKTYTLIIILGISAGVSLMFYEYAVNGILVGQLVPSEIECETSYGIVTLSAEACDKYKKYRELNREYFDMNRSSPLNLDRYIEFDKFLDVKKENKIAQTIIAIAPGVPLIILTNGNAAVYAPALEMHDLVKIYDLDMIVIEYLGNGWVELAIAHDCYSKDPDQDNCNWNVI